MDKHRHYYTYSGMSMQTCGLYCHHMDSVRPIIEKGFIQLDKNPEILETFSLEQLDMLKKYVLERVKKAQRSVDIATRKFGMIDRIIQSKQPNPTKVE